MHVITETIMVGNIYDARTPPSFVVALLLAAEEQQVVPRPGTVYERVPLKEFSEANPQQVQRAVEWLEEHAPKHPTLVCCRAGMGRSVSVIIAYLCCVKGMPYTEAVAFVKARRPGALPLPNLEQTIQKVLALRRVKAHEATSRGWKRFAKSIRGKD